MSLITGLFSEVPFLLFPSDWIGWLGMILWFGGIIALLWYWRGFNKPRNRSFWILWIGLLVITPAASLVLGVRLPAGSALPPPGITIEPVGPALMLFSAVPWMLAAGLLGPAPAVSVAALSGILLAYWDTHSIFTPFELALLAILFSVAVSQRYRTRLYALLRFPSIAALVTAGIYPIVNIFGAVFLAQGTLVARIDFAILQVMAISFAVGGAVVIAGVVAEFGRIFAPRRWGGEPPWLPSPAESRLETRLIFNMAPLAIALILTLMVGDWIAAGNAAQEMLQERMASASELAAQNVPFFLDAGQNLILQYAQDERLLDADASSDQLREVLKQMLQATPYFRQLFLLDENGSVAGYPVETYESVYAPIEEMTGFNLAMSGVLVQVYAIPQNDGDLSALISFIAALDINGTKRVLIGRTDLYSNPFSQSILSSLNSLEDVNGEGYLLDEDGRILYHPDPNRLMQDYVYPDVEGASFYIDTTPTGTRQFVHYQSAVGRPWSVVIAVPAQSAQQLAIRIAAPLLVMIVMIAILALVILRLGLRTVITSLKTLAAQADRISKGELDQSLSVDGEDEISQLRRAFEQMRIRLKGRLHELNQLLEVSQGVAASLEMEDAVHPILKSALSTGGVAARVVLIPTVLPDSSIGDRIPSRFGFGAEAELFGFLDDQILLMMRTENEVVIPNTNLPSKLDFTAGLPRPNALIAVALRHENLYYGVLWVAFNHPHNFTNEEKRFIVTLAGQAALAASNAHLFMKAEIGRQRLAAILASTPDPVLVTDHRDHLLLLNPAALQSFQVKAQSGVGQPISDVLEQPELIDLMQIETQEDESVEVTLHNGRVYLATASSIMADGQPMGRVCVLRDVTHFKELDALKSEFVSTVSHDLRSPLTLMRGYATMLEMVGDLNSQQEGYVQKIVVGVESMSRLVNNLLDLGRIEAEIGLRLEMLSVHDIIEQVTEALSGQATQKQIDIHVDISERTIPLIEADQALLQQALHNLVENAIKYTPSGGDIWVSIHIRQNQMVFDVRDTGIGISPVDQPRLFEKFYRSANRDAKRERGTGLGLAIVKSIAERHGGQVGVRSKLGSGSTFFISIPLRQPKKS